MKVSVLFQSRSTSGPASEVCSPDLVFLSATDIRALKCRIGSCIALHFNAPRKADGGNFQHSLCILCRVWPSQKTLGNGRATLNRVWWPNLPTEQNVRFATLEADVGHYCVLPCARATLSIQGNGEMWEAAAKSTLFASYVVSCVENVSLEVGIILGLTWKGSPCLVRVEELRDQEGGRDGSSSSSSLRMSRYIIDFSTSLTFLLEGPAVSGPGQEQLWERVAAGSQLSGFVGYDSQQGEAINLMRLGLCIGDTGQQFAQLAATTPSNSNSSPTSANATSLLRQQLFKPPRGLLIHGPPGTGKSTLIKTLVQTIGGCASVEISFSILQHKFVGEAEAELQRVFQWASAHAPCCVLIDDADLLCRSRADSQTSQLQRRIVSCLLSLLDGVSASSTLTGVFVIAATTSPNSIDAAFRRPGRFDKEIELGVPNTAQREAILAALVDDSRLLLASQGAGVSILISQDGISQVARQAHGMVGSDLLQVLKEAQLLALYRTTAEESYGSLVDPITVATAELESLSLAPSSFSVTDDDLLLALSKVPPSALREIVVEIPTVRWTDIGGMESVKQSLHEVVEWPLLYADLFASFAVHPPRGVLLYGPPGCSKTLMAKALATEGGMNFLTVRGPELLSKWLGESEKAVQTLFRRARAAAPSVVFFDEIDALAGKRGSTSAGVNDRVLAQLLSELDGIQSSHASQRVIVMAATNRPDMLDAALIRPGRIDRKVYVPPPDALSREQIFRLELRKIPTSCDLDLAKLAEISEGFSGAEVVAVCAEAAMLAVDEERDVISQVLLEQVARSIKPQITDGMLEYYRKLSF